MKVKEFIPSESCECVSTEIVNKCVLKLVNNRFLPSPICIYWHLRVAKSRIVINFLLPKLYITMKITFPPMPLSAIKRVSHHKNSG